MRTSELTENEVQVQFNIQHDSDGPYPDKEWLVDYEGIEPELFKSWTLFETTFEMNLISYESVNRA